MDTVNIEVNKHLKNVWQFYVVISKNKNFIFFHYICWHSTINMSKLTPDGVEKIFRKIYVWMFHTAAM